MRTTIFYLAKKTDSINSFRTHSSCEILQESLIGEAWTTNLSRGVQREQTCILAPVRKSGMSAGPSLRGGASKRRRTRGTLFQFPNDPPLSNALTNEFAMFPSKPYDSFLKYVGKEFWWPVSCQTSDRSFEPTWLEDDFT